MVRLPTWVKEPSGRLVPFDADRISRRLFAASAALGFPNAFLARELTDGVVHFMAQGDFGETAPATEIDEFVAKIVRELGQPALAAAFADTRDDAPKQAGAEGSIPFELPFAEAMGQVRKTYALQSVFGPDLRSACNEGFLAIGGLQAPDRLAAQVVASPLADRVAPWEAGWRLVRAAAVGAGGRVVLEQIERHCDSLTPMGMTQFLQGVRAGLEAANATLVAVLHDRSEAALAQEQRPLFADEAGIPDLAPFYRQWFDCWERASLGRFGVVHWLVRESSLSELPMAYGKRADADDVVYVFDRPRKPLSLAEGLVRPSPAILLEVGLRLDRFAATESVGGNIAALLEKLGSLVRMAISAAARKRAYLRGMPEAQRGFLPDRATLHLAPLGLDAVVRQLLGESLVLSKLSRDLACRIAARLREVVRAENRNAHFDIVLDSPAELEDAANPVAAPLRGQLEAWGETHGKMGQGTATVWLGERDAATIADALAFALRKTDVCRVRFRRPSGIQPEFKI